MVRDLDAAEGMTPELLKTLQLTPVNEPHWSALVAGRLMFQRCACGHSWLPPRAECPQCLQPAPTWVQARGAGSLVSWVVFHVAYHPSLQDELPYNVAIIELQEGPRLVSNVVGCPDGRGLFAGAAVEFDSGESRRTGRAQFRLLEFGESS
jgi:uncharacterized protein